MTLLYHGRDTHAYAVPDDALDNYIQDRVAHVRKKGGANPIDLRLASGDIIRFQCTTLPAGGRMLSYTDVTTSFTAPMRWKVCVPPWTTWSRASSSLTATSTWNS